MPKTKQSGFHVVELALILVVVGLIGLVGYKVMHYSKPSSQPAAQTVQHSAGSAPAIKAAADLNTASATVDQLDTASAQADMDSIEQDLNNL